MFKKLIDYSISHKLVIGVLVPALAASMAQTEYANTQAELAQLLSTNANINPTATAFTPVAFAKGDGYNYAQTPERGNCPARICVSPSARRWS